ncbi:MAG: amino acid adenylation domain-containing protein [Blastochloris sp.]|nr:amino acid adenylation domain-containing protein [Blastochloris sp.]
MIPEAIIALLRGLDIVLWVEEGRLRYKAPKGSLSPDIRKMLTENRDALVAFLQEASQLQATSVEKIPSVDHTVPQPLSFAQQRLWFLEQFGTDPGTYNIIQALSFEGILNGYAIERSFQTISNRHASLRTTFIATDGEPHQVIAEPSSIYIPLIDFSHLPESLATSYTQRLISSEATFPFDLRISPLFRIFLFRMSQEKHILLFNIHHIITDGWSMGVLVNELMALYQTYCSTSENPLPDLPLQYVDYAVWQRQWLQDAVLEAHLDYWRRGLADLPVLELPTDYARPPIQTFNGSSLPVAIDTATCASLHQLNQEHGTTLFMSLLAAFQIVLSRYSGQEDFAVGTPVAGRDNVALEQLIGFFVNTLILRADLAGNPTFQELLDRTQKVTLDAYTYQALPFERLVDELQPQRDLSRPPLVQVSFALQNIPIGDLQLANLDINGIEVDHESAKFELFLELVEQSGSVHGTLKYNTDLFDTSTMMRLADYFLRIVQSVAACPSIRLFNISLLSEQEQHQILVEWNRVFPIPVPPETVNALFTAQYLQTPDVCALVSTTDTLTYEALFARATSVAMHLQNMGVGPDTRVGVCLPRSTDLIVSVLATLLAGGAYVSLDPTYPSERLSWMLDDSDPTVVVTHATLANTLQLAGKKPICLVDTIFNSSEAAPLSQPQLSPDNLAYLIYTSGSTGVPKGVAITHRNAVALLVWAQHTFQLETGQGILAATSLNFDLSVFELFLPLSTGGTIILAENALALPDHPASHSVTLVNTVPSAMRELVRQGGIPDSVTTVNLAGEALPGPLVKQIYQSTQVQAVYNLYGPSEDTTYSTGARIARGEARPPIGRPISNTQAYILDVQSHPVPIGVSGELYLGGMGVTQGYWRRPGHTAASFIPDPFGNQCGGRLYRTGDQARWRTDGQIEYLGRLDGQVKVRGYRIELGEIEVALMRHTSVESAVVIVAERGDSGQQLVAYVVPTEEAKQAHFTQDLQTSLQQNLPGYMVPSIYITLDALPLTPNGKLDRRALPAPNFVSQDRIMPQTEVEQQLARIWQQVLGLDSIGIHDNFFALGGDSIISIQVIARANQAGMQLTPRLIFQYPTIAELAQQAQNAPTIVAEQGLTTGPTKLTAIQQAFLTNGGAQPHHYNQSVLLRVPRLLDYSMLRTVFSALLEHHDGLRLRIVRTEDGYLGQYVDMASMGLPLLHIDLTNIPVADHAGTIEECCADMQTSLNLIEGPLVRMVYFNTGSSAGRLFIVAHHLVVDGVSWRILLEDLQTIVEQITTKQPIQLPLKTTSFQQWTETLAAAVTEPDILEEATYWNEIATASVVPLPRDYDSDLEQLTHTTTENVPVYLNESETRALLQAVPEAYGTHINDVLLTALAQSLTRWVGGSRVRVALEGHGRVNRFATVDLTRTVGWFTTLYPVLLDLGPNPDVGMQLCAIKEQLRAVPDQGVGYGLLRYFALIILILHYLPLHSQKYCLTT